MKNKLLATLAVLAALLLLAGILAWPRVQLLPSSSPAAYAATPANVARGAYLAKAGDCMACHTARGGAPYAGGRGLDTPFGTLVAPNITPDRDTGIGAWSADDFWNALHNGIAKDGRLLYFKPAVFAEARDQTPMWNRGAYLVEGLGHCAACHSSRNSFGASAPGLSGGLIPMLGWYAPSLTSDAEAGLGSWDLPHIAQLLQTGASPRATVFGPMAEVVERSLQHLSDQDVMSMAVYLKALPATPDELNDPITGPLVEQVVAQGKKLYGTHCADCHGADGKGLPPNYPPLAGNRALTMDASVNAIRIVLNGGFAPGTAGNPRPYGMPPYSHVLDDAEVAAVVSYLRASWGNRAPPVTAGEVNRYRSVPID